MFGAEEVEVVLDDVGSEDLPRPRTGLERGDRLVQRVRHLGKVAGLIEIALEGGGWLDLVLDAVESRGQRGRECEIRICVGAGHAALDSTRGPMSHDAEAGP